MGAYERTFETTSTLATQRRKAGRQANRSSTCRFSLDRRTPSQLPRSSSSVASGIAAAMSANTPAAHDNSASVITFYATGGVAGGQQQQQMQQRQGAAAQVFRMPPPPSKQQQALIADSARQQYERLRQQRPSQVRQNVMMSAVVANVPGAAQAQQQQMQSHFQQLQAQRLAHMKQQEQRWLQQQQLQHQGQQQQLQQQKRNVSTTMAEYNADPQQQQQQQIQPQQPQQQQYQWNEASSIVNAYNGYQQQQTQLQMQQTQQQQKQQQGTQRKELQRQQRHQKTKQRQLELQQQQQFQFQQQQQLQQQQQYQKQQYQPPLQQYQRQQQKQQRAIPSDVGVNKVTQQQQPRHLQQQQQFQPREQPQRQQLHVQPQQQQQQLQIQPQQQEYQRQRQQKPSRMNAKKVSQQSQPQQFQQPQQQQQFQRAFQFLDSEIRESANSGNTSDSSGTGQRSTTVIQPGVAIVPPHYRDQISIEMPALPRLGPPSFHFSFAQGHGPSYNGSSYGGYPGSEYANGGGAQSNGSMMSSNLQSPPMQTTSSAPVTFVAFGAPSDGWMLPFTDYNDGNGNSNNSIPVENHFGQTTWNREQHYSPAASAIIPSFNANDSGHQPSNVFSEPHEMMSLQQQQEENRQQQHQQQQQHNPATMAAAKALFGLQSPVNSPRWNEVNAEVSNTNPWLQTQSRAKSTLEKAKVKKASAEFALSRIVNPLEMSAEDQNKELMSAAESTVDGDFLDVVARSAGYDPDAKTVQPAPVQRVPLLVPVPVRPPPRQEAAPQQFSTEYFVSDGHMSTAEGCGGNGALAPSRAVQSVGKAVVVPPAKEEPKKKAPVKRKRVNDTATVQERQIQMPMPTLSTTLGLSLDEGWVVPKSISKKKVYKPRVKAVQKLKASSNAPRPPATSAEPTVKKKAAPVKRGKKQEETIAPSNKKPQAPPILSAATTAQPPQPNRVTVPNLPAPAFARPPNGQLNASRLPAVTMVLPTARNLMSSVETASNQCEGVQPPMNLAVGMARAPGFGNVYGPPETALQITTAAGKKKKADPTVPKQPSAKRRNAQRTAPAAAKGPKTSRKRKSDATPATGYQLSSSLNSAAQPASGNVQNTVKEAMESLMAEATATNNRVLAFSQPSLPGSMQLPSVGGLSSVATSSCEKMVMVNGGIRSVASEKNAATADPQALSATVKGLVPPSNASSMIDLVAEDKSSVQISAESSLKASTLVAKPAVEVAFAGIQPEAATTGSLLEQLQSLNAPPPVSSEPNNTVMIFCKRDFMRYQAARLWKKYQEKKKKMEFQSVQVLGKRTRFVNAKYEEEKLAKAQKKVKGPKKIRKSKSVENSEDSLSSSPSVLEQVDAVAESSAESSGVKPAEPVQSIGSDPTEHGLFDGLQASDEARPSDEVFSDEAPGVEADFPEHLSANEMTLATAALIVRPTGGALPVESTQQDPQDKVPAKNFLVANATEQDPTVTLAAEALNATLLEQTSVVVPSTEGSLALHTVEAPCAIFTEEDLSFEDHIAAPSEEALRVLSTTNDTPVLAAIPTAETETLSVIPTTEATRAELPTAAPADEASGMSLTVDDASMAMPTAGALREQPRVVWSVLESLEAAITTFDGQSPRVATTKQSLVEPPAQEASSTSSAEEAQAVIPLAHAPLEVSPEKQTDIEMTATDATLVPMTTEISNAVPNADAPLEPQTRPTQGVEPNAGAEVTPSAEQDQSVREKGTGHAPLEVSSTTQTAPVETLLPEILSASPVEGKILVTPLATKDPVVTSTLEVISSAALSIVVPTETAPIALSVAEAQDELSAEKTLDVMATEQVQAVIPAPEVLEAAIATPVRQLLSVPRSDQTHDVEPVAETQVSSPTQQIESESDASADLALREALATVRFTPPGPPLVVETLSVAAADEALDVTQVAKDQVMIPVDDASLSADMPIAAPTAEILTTLSAAEVHDEVSSREAPSLTLGEQPLVVILAGEAPEASAAVPSRQCSNAKLSEQPPSPGYEPPSETSSVSEEIPQVEMPSENAPMVPLIAEGASALRSTEPSSGISTARSQDEMSDNKYQMVPVLELDQSVKKPNTDASCSRPDAAAQMNEARVDHAPSEIPAPAESQDAMSTTRPAENPVAKPPEEESPTATVAEDVPETEMLTDKGPVVVSPMAGALRIPTDDWSATPTSDFSSSESAQQASGVTIALEAPSVRLFERSARIAQDFCSNAIARAPATPIEKPREVTPIAKAPSPPPRAQAPVTRQSAGSLSPVVTSIHTQILILRPDASIVVAPSGQVSSAISAARALRVASTAAEGSSATQGDASVNPSSMRMGEESTMTRAAIRQAPREELIWISASAQQTNNCSRNTVPPSDEVMNASSTDQAASNDVAMPSAQAPTASLVLDDAIQVTSNHDANSAEQTPDDVIVSSAEEALSSDALSIQLTATLDDSECVSNGEVKPVEESSSSGETTDEMMPDKAIPISDTTKFGELAENNKATPEEPQSSSNETVVADQGEAGGTSFKRSGEASHSAHLS